MKNKKRLVPWLIAAVIIAALAVIGKKLYDLMFGGSLAVTTEDLKNGIIACSPAIIFIVVVLIAALIVVVAAGKLKQPKRALVRAQAPIAILLAITLSVNWVILGVEYSVVNSVFAEDVKVSDETMASGRAIADQIASEGIVLLKNDDKALPLSAGTKLNLFGWSSVRPLYGGTGSGDSDTSNAVSLIDGLKHAGFEVNEELVKFYENFRTERPVGTIRLREIGSKRGDFTVPEPTIAEYENANIFEDAVAYSDTAVVVVSRTGGEGFDVPQSITSPDEYNAQYGGLAQFYDFTTQAEDLDASKSYLELSNREIAMVDRVCKEFKNVIVVVNSSNAMELGWLDQYDSIKAAVLCGAPGELGFDSLGKILSGEVNPSGHLADTYVYDLLATPTINNFGGFAYDNYAEVTGSQDNRAMFVNYCEGIYVGYKFYETAAAEGLIDYDKVVQYPFGYGLSYTTFDSSIAAVEDDGEKITLDVAVKNTGDTAGKYVAEIFYEPPYYNGGIEKAAANLVQYAKTEILQPGEAQTLKITFRYEDMASYDSNGIKSANGAYVLEAGDYKINLCSDSHTILDTYVAKVDKDVIYDDIMHWIREGGLFVIVCNLITVFKYILLQFLPAAFANMPKVDFGWPGIEVTMLGATFKWNILGYDAEHGGLPYFCAYMIAMILGEVINFPIQRNVVFRSKGNLTRQIVWYAVAFCVITCIVNSINCIWVATAARYVPDFIYNIGTTVLNGGVSMVIFFFVNKVIFPTSD